MKNENYYVVHGWMINELQLKGADLIIYAVIHGFSQTSDTFFTGSTSYLAQASNVSRRHVFRSLNSLTEQGYLEKKIVTIKGTEYPYYRAVINCHTPMTKNHILYDLKSQPPYDKTSPNNIDTYNIDNNKDTEKSKNDFPTPVLNWYNELIKFFPEHLKPKNKKAENQWLDTIDKLNRIDEHPLEAVYEIVKFARTDDFWSKNFLAIPKLRKKNKEGVPYFIVFAEAFKKTKKFKSVTNQSKNKQGWF